MLRAAFLRLLALPENPSAGTPLSVSGPKIEATPPMLYDLVFSPDGRRLAAARNNRMVTVWAVESGGRLCEFEVDYTPYRIAFTPDSTRLLFCCRTRVIEEWAIPEGRRLRVLKRAKAPGLCYAFSPDGRLAAVAGGAKRITIYELENGRELEPLLGTHGASVVNFSPSGRSVVAGVLGQKDGITAWDFESRRVTWSIRPRTMGSASVIFSPDESLVACGGWDGSVTLFRADTGEIHAHLRAPRPGNARVAFHPDSHHLLAADNVSIGFLDASTGEETVLGPPHALSVTQVAVSPDGCFAAAGGFDASVCLWAVGG